MAVSEEQEPETTVARRKRGSSTFGWCLDGFHARCWVVNQGLSCGCECHRDGAK